MQPSGGPWVNREPMRPSSRSIERSRRNIDIHDSIEGCGWRGFIRRERAGSWIFSHVLFVGFCCSKPGLLSLGLRFQVNPRLNLPVSPRCLDCPF
jgi:hypothetical protein